MHIRYVKRKKFDSKAQKLTFIRYPEQHKAYRFVDLVTEKVTVSRDAKFMDMDDGVVPQEELGYDPVEDEVQWNPDAVPRQTLKWSRLRAMTSRKDMCVLLSLRVNKANLNNSLT